MSSVAVSLHSVRLLPLRKMFYFTGLSDHIQTLSDTMEVTVSVLKRALISL